MNLNIIGLFLIALIWGSTFVIVKNSLKEVSPILFITIRFWIAWITLLIFFPKKILLSKKNITNSIYCGILLFGGFLLQTIGLLYTSVGNSGFLTGLYVVIAPAIGTWFFKSKINRYNILGIIFAIIGVWFISSNPSLTSSINKGDILTIISSFFFSLHIVLLGYFGKNHTDSIDFVTGQILVCAVLSTIFTFIFESFQINFGASAIISLIFMGVVATALVFALQTIIQKNISVVTVVLIFIIEPVIAVITGNIFLNEEITERKFLGFFLIIFAIIISEQGPPIIRNIKKLI